MGFLREKKVKTYHYWYWCHRKRDRKKKGGSGTVKSIELYLGRNILSLEYAPFWIWQGEIKKSEYLQQLMDQLVKQSFGDLVGVEVKGDKIKFHGKPSIDLRRKRWSFDLLILRKIRFHHALEQVNLFDREIEYLRGVAGNIAEANRRIAEIENLIKKNKSRGKDDIEREESLESLAANYERHLAGLFSVIDLHLSKLLEKTPDRYKRETKEKLCNEIYKR